MSTARTCSIVTAGSAHFLAGRIGITGITGLSPIQKWGLAQVGWPLMAPNL